MPKKAMSVEWADHSFLFSRKMQSERNSFTALFPIDAEKIPVELCLTALMVLDPANMLAESFIFHGEDEIEFLATIN